MGAYAPLPTIGGVSACSADVSGFYVSVASENLDLVETFLTEYVSEECQNKAEYGYPYYMLIDKIAGYSRVWQEIDMKAGVFDYRDTTELLRVTSYDNIVLKGRNHEMNRAFGYNSELKAYLDGEIEIDTYIQYVQPKLDLIQYE